MPGTATSAIEVSNISMHGFWLLVDERELFLPFGEFPWFQDATVAQILDVERPQTDHLYWPKLDIDLTLAMIEDPSEFPLVAKG